MPTQHALLSASSAHRWLHCTGSPLLEKDFPDSTSVYAQEGTLAHELCELKLKKYTTVMPKGTYTRAHNKIMKSELWQNEMESTSETYLEYVKGIMLSCEIAPAVLIEKRVDFSRYVPEGFGTADCLILAGDTLHVIDYKHGKGVVVDADHNPQMMLYALGAMDELSLLYRFKSVHMVIVQPRVNNISEFTMTADELTEWGESVVKPKAEAAISGNGEFEAGDWCRFCRAKRQCKTRYESNDSLYPELSERHDPRLITLAELGEYLKRGKDMAAWLEDMKEYALSESLAGADVPGWKAVEGRGSRAFTDTDEAVNTLVKNGIDESVLYERRVLTLAQMEKAVGKKAFGELVGDLVVKNPGKPTLVEESDKRPKITNQPTAADVFNS
jgi:phage protein